MVPMPAAFALSSTALPVPESRLTIIRTVTPPVIIWSAMVWNAALSPWAFWMSYWTPAFLNAASRYGRSAVSQRTDDLLSGRMTPILGVFAAGVLLPPVLQADRPPIARRPTAANVRMPLRIADPFLRCAALQRRFSAQVSVVVRGTVHAARSRSSRGWLRGAAGGASSYSLDGEPVGNGRPYLWSWPDPVRWNCCATQRIAAADYRTSRCEQKFVVASNNSATRPTSARLAGARIHTGPS